MLAADSNVRSGAEEQIQSAPLTSSDSSANLVRLHVGILPDPALYKPYFKRVRHISFCNSVRIVSGVLTRCAEPFSSYTRRRHDYYFEQA